MAARGFAVRDYQCILQLILNPEPANLQALSSAFLLVSSGANQ